MNDDNGKNLTSEEIELNSIFDEASTKIKEVENQIKNLPSDKGPSFKPSGMLGGSSQSTKAQYEFRLKAESQRLETEAKDKAAKVLGKSSPNVRDALSQKIEKWRNPDYKEKHENKNIPQSQEYLLRNMGKANHQKEQEQSRNEVQNSAPNKEDLNSKRMSMSTRFKADLGYSNMQYDLDKVLDKSGKFHKIDDKETNSKPMSMRFSTTLSHNKMLDKNDKVTEKTDKSREIDLEKE